MFRMRAMTAPRLAVFPKGFFDAIVTRKMSLTRWLDLAATLGVDGVEMYPRFFDSLDAATIRRVRKDAQDRGLAVPMMCHSPDFTIPDRAGREAEIERTRTVIETTAGFGGAFCRVLSGQNRPGLDPVAVHGWVTSAIESVLPTARAAGITLVIENHYKDGLWEYPEFAQSQDRFLAIVRAVPELMVQYDPSNAIVAGDDQYALLEKILPRVATMHASDRYLEGGTVEDLRKIAAEPGTGYARFLKHGVIGRGLNDYDRIFSRLSAAGFAGWVSIEDGEAPTIEEGVENLKSSAVFLRAKMAAHFGVWAQA